MEVYGNIHGGGEPLLVRWTTEFDCTRETNWWYCICDKPFDISTLKAKRRYEINRGIKNFTIKKIDPIEYKERLYEIQEAALVNYPQKYRKIITKEQFFTSVKKWCNNIVFGAFHNESNDLVGYAILNKRDEKCLHFYILKVIPEFERLSINAAIVASILSYYEDFLKHGGYICDGARNINHETKFQEYLEKYFRFRKAYCVLNIDYNPKIKWFIKIFYPFRKIFQKFDKVAIIHKINAVFLMEEIVHTQKSLK